jgi:regulation of enolase protein 1 (concanavalin A-like superfamily)
MQASSPSNHSEWTTRVVTRDEKRVSTRVKHESNRKFLTHFYEGASTYPHARVSPIGVASLARVYHTCAKQRTHTYARNTTHMHARDVLNTGANPCRIGNVQIYQTDMEM